MPFVYAARHQSRYALVDLRHLGKRLVRAAAVVLGTVGEEPVNDHSDNGEEENDQTPEQLVNRRAVGFQDLDCCTKVSQHILYRQHWEGDGRETRTEDDDVQDQDNEANDAAAGAVLPGVSGRRGRDVLYDGGAKGERSQAELEKESEESMEHLDCVH